MISICSLLFTCAYPVIHANHFQSQLTHSKDALNTKKHSRKHLFIYNFVYRNISRFLCNIPVSYFLFFFFLHVFMTQMLLSILCFCTFVSLCLFFMLLPQNTVCDELKGCLTENNSQHRVHLCFRSFQLHLMALLSWTRSHQRSLC